uniref:Uncharacterized protein n=1 Tax=Pygocentrus nattereri TaxID=42514 RepID=A0A3B4DFY3_PYGNA
MTYRHFLHLVALLLIGSEVTFSGNILVLPGEFSHWYNMRVIVDELITRNHSVTVLIHSASSSISYMQKENFKYTVFKINMEKTHTEIMWQNFINAWMNETVTGIKTLSLFWNILSEFEEYFGAACEGMLLNQELIASLRESHFDVLLFDPMMPCSDLLAENLGLPQVLSIRFTLAYSLERLCGQLPTPPSYVPAVASQGHLTDHMNFIQRVENVLLYVAHTAVFKRQIMLMFDKYYTKITDTFIQSDLQIMRYIEQT